MQFCLCLCLFVVDVDVDDDDDDDDGAAAAGVVAFPRRTFWGSPSMCINKYNASHNYGQPEAVFGGHNMQKWKYYFHFCSVHTDY